MKVLTIVLCLLVTFAFAQKTAYFGESALSSAPAVDGVADDVYGTQVPIDVVDTTATAPDDADDLSGYFQVGWSGDSLYFFVSVTDDVMDTDAAEEWQNDGYEFFLDGDNSAGETYDGLDDLHITIEPNETTQEGITTADAELWTGTSCTFGIIPNDYGYDAETALNLEDAYLNDACEANGIIGFDLQLNDADGSGRDHMMRFNNANNDNWLNPSLWGKGAFQDGGDAIDLPDVQIVQDFQLDQNYPNPFNPATTINYTINTAGKVNLTVYNVLGKEVATLVNNFQTANDYSVVFDGASLTSGVYFYKLTVGSSVDTKKMILMK
jgi:hypothetical protein